MLGNYYDDEAMAVAKGLPDLHPSDQVEAVKYAKWRKELFIAGRAMAPDFWNRALQAYDPTLQMRFSLEHGCFVVDRWVENDECWYPILYWRDGDGTPHGTSETLIPMALNILARNNLQARYRDEKQYLALKREKAEENKKRHSDARTEAMLEAVDSLSSKSIKTFIDAHRAIHTGEKIVAHGQDEKFLEHAAKVGGNVPVNKEMNPGMHPLRYKRQPRRK